MVFLIRVKERIKDPYSCSALIIVPNKPTIPRNSNLLRFFTMYSSLTFEMAYNEAPTRTRMSPTTTAIPAQKDTNEQEQETVVKEK